MWKIADGAWGDKKKTFFVVGRVVGSVVFVGRNF
jgi:hypothetical protein